MRTHFQKLTFLGLFILFFLFSATSFSQLSGIFTVPGSYTSIGAAINDLNLLGVSGPVTINITAGYTENCPFGGYALTATGTSTAPITFQKSGAGPNPLITAYTGVATASNSVQDGIWRMVGSDYITIDGIDLNDPTFANPDAMEYGYAFYKAGPTNGCQFNTIKNCTITLSYGNNTTGTVIHSPGSRCIDVVNALPASATTTIAVTSPAGSNSNNKFYNNLFKSCNTCISLVGFSDTSPYSNADRNNDVGGISAATSNTIMEFGYVGTTNPVSGVRTIYQYDVNVSNNLINSNPSIGFYNTSHLCGINTSTARGANTTINNNTITVRNTAFFGLTIGIYNTSGDAGLTNTISINKNLIRDCITNHPGSNEFRGISNEWSDPAVLSVCNNTFVNNTSDASISNYYNIHNTGNVLSMLDISNNVCDSTMVTNPINFTFNGIHNVASGLSTNIRINKNTFKNLVFSGSLPAPSNAHFIHNQATATTGSCSIDSNAFGDHILPITGGGILIYNSGNALLFSVKNNSLTGGIKKTGSGGIFAGLYSNNSATGATLTISNNNFSGMYATGNTIFHGIYHTGGNSSIVNITSNTVSAITGGTTLTNGINMSVCNALSTLNNNLITNINSAGTTIGIRIGEIAGNNPGFSIGSNTVSSIFSTRLDAIGIQANYGLNIRIFKNRIYDVTTTSNLPSASAQGIDIHPLASSSNTTSVYNNLIGDIKAPNGYNHPDGSVRGININSNAASGSVNLNYNTIYLDAVSTSSILNTNGIFHLANSFSSTTKLTAKNNIVINNSNPGVGGRSCAFQRLGTPLGNFAATSNNNLYYAGTPGPQNLIYYDGTNSYQTLSSYTTAVAPRDANAVTENSPVFTNVGTSTAFLHINPALPTIAESGAVNTSSIADDFDVETRQGNPGYTGSGSAPDIGADEFNQATVPCTSVSSGTITPPSIGKCYGQSGFFNSSGFTSAAGITYQWMYSTTSSGPYTNVTSGIGGNSVAYGSSGSLSPGTYYFVLVSTCTVTSVSDTSNEVQLTVHPLPVITIVGTNTVCYKDSAVLNATGGNSYIWSTSTTNSTITTPTLTMPASYSVTGTDLNGCVSNASTTVNVIPPASITITVSPACLGSPFTATVSGAVTYSWSTGSTSNVMTDYPTVPTTYSVICTSSTGCSDIATMSIIVYPQPTLSIASTASVLCVGHSATLSAGGAMVYTWTPAGFSSNITISPTVSATYTLIGRDGNGCKDTITYTQIVSPCTSLDNLNADSSSIKIYPNPNNGEFTIEGPEQGSVIYIYNSLGQLIFYSSVQDSITNIDLAEKGEGLYLLKIHYSDQVVRTFRVIKTQSIR